VVLQKHVQGLPSELPVLTPLRQRVFPLSPGELQKRMELSRIPRDPVVVEVTTQDTVDGTDLRFDGMVPDTVEQIPHSSFRTAESLPLRLEHRLAYRLTAAPGPVNREAQKRQPASLVVLCVCPSTEVGPVSLLLSEREPELSQTSLQQSPHRVPMFGRSKKTSSVLVAVAALRFLYRVTLGKDWNFDDVIPAPQAPRTLPAVLSPGEVAEFLGAVQHIRARTVLTVCYAAGLRISEAVRLKVSDIDSPRGVIRVGQEKGLKDRYVMLSPELRKVLQTWWRLERPQHWLLPGRHSGAIGVHAVQAACHVPFSSQRIRVPVLHRRLRLHLAPEANTPPQASSKTASHSDSSRHRLGPLPNSTPPSSRTAIQNTHP